MCFIIDLPKNQVLAMEKQIGHILPTYGVYRPVLLLIIKYCLPKYIAQVCYALPFVKLSLYVKGC